MTHIAENYPQFKNRSNFLFTWFHKSIFASSDFDLEESINVALETCLVKEIGV